jgi:V8-like Glu-specific endopeptidase
MIVSKTWKLLVPFLALGLVGAVAAQAQVRVGEEASVNLGRSALDAAEGALAVHHAGATFIKVHFADVTLPAGSRLVVSNPDDPWQSSIITSAELAGDGSAWAHEVDGDTAVVSISGSPAGVSFRIDRYGHGTVPLDGHGPQESVIGSDDREDRECFPGTNYWTYSTPIGRMLYTSDAGGQYVGTGTLVSPTNLFLTVGHGVNTEPEVDSLTVRFNYEETTCGGTTDKTFTTVGSAANTLRKTNAGLNYTLLTLAGNAAATFGYLPTNGVDLQTGDSIWLPQHPLGGTKKIHKRWTGSLDGQCRVKKADWSEPGYNASSSIQHTCDTDAGTAGSPVLNGSYQIVALHHSGYGFSAECSKNSGAGPPCNGAIEMENIYPEIASFFPQSQGGSHSGGIGWSWYFVLEAWRYNTSNSERIWLNMNGNSDTAWVDAKLQPTIGHMFKAAAESGHRLGIYWTSATAFSNVRLED